MLHCLLCTEINLQRLHYLLGICPSIYVGTCVHVWCRQVLPCCALSLRCQPHLPAGPCPCRPVHTLLMMPMQIHTYILCSMYLPLVGTSHVSLPSAQPPSSVQATRLQPFLKQTWLDSSNTQVLAATSPWRCKTHCEGPSMPPLYKLLLASPYLLPSLLAARQRAEHI